MAPPLRRTGPEGAEATQRAAHTERLFVKLDEDPIAGPESGTPSQALVRLPVPAPLHGLVSHVLEYREAIAPGTEVLEHVLPDGVVRIVLHLGGTPAATIVGARTTAATVRLHGRMHGLSLALRPGAAAALLGLPAAELAGRALPLEAAWGNDAATLIGRLMEARSVAARSAALQAMLQRRWERQHRAEAPAIVTAALGLMRGAGTGPTTLPAVAASLGLGERRLQQLFHQHVGLSPRAWRRLARLQGIVRAVRHAAARPGARGPDWAELAVETGFYDQAHFANEFRSLAGLTPGEFWRRAVWAVSDSSKTPG